ncbi:IST1 homolog isoform X2 [Onthophagus taurus]|uniref:IST1 homolog isoform X2 n=1 Tax=Onthophagus taurus TaxID=166361 RepID=UPI000C20A58A|nr:IST1 homolog isoform X2 [Onthophagus taurus]
MFSSGPNYTKLKTHLRLAINRLKLLEKKKSELTQKSRREIADFIQAGKYERAKIRVEHIVREDYLVEAMEVVEMYCDLLLARFGLITQMKDLDEGIAEAIASIMWVAPRLQSDCPELKVIADLLAGKYGLQFAEACRNESETRISPKLKHKMSIQSPPKLLVEKYLIEIAKTYDIPYDPDPQILGEGNRDGMLIDLSDKNNLGGGNVYPPGFIGYPQPPPLPLQGPFNYPPMGGNIPDQGGFVGPLNPSAPSSSNNPPYGAPFSYNIPPGAESKESNTDFGNKEQPKPAPRTKMPEGNNYPDLPELPSVPTDDHLTSPTNNDDIDFDDLTRRFEELKKRK